jgi:prepilin-type N-terminal cleavage/methylation domain-containing protein
MNSLRLDRIKNGRGFTLIEAIVSLMVAGILAAGVVNFVGTSVTKSADPVILAQRGEYLNSIMNNMTSDYNAQMTTALVAGSYASGLITFSSNVGAETSKQSRYTDGSNCAANDSYCYTVVANHRVSFSGSPLTETPNSGSHVLRVTINYQGMLVTALFTE